MALFMHAAALAQPLERQIFDLGTATPEGISHPLGVTLAALIKLKLLPTENIDINARNTEGSKDNAIQLRNAELDFAILDQLDAYHAAHGTGPFLDQGADSDLRLLTNLWTRAYYFVVRPEFAATGTFADFLGLKGKRIALGEDSSEVGDHARRLLDTLNVDVDRDYQVKNLGSQDAADAFLNGDLEGFLLIDDHRGADILAFLEKARNQAVALTISDDKIDALNRDREPVWTPVVSPVESLPQPGSELVTIGMRNLLCTRKQIAEPFVYQIVKTIFDNLLFLNEMHAATVGISLETALNQLTLPVHDGARDYYREVGVAVPEPEPVLVSELSRKAFLSRYGTAEEARARLNNGAITVLVGQAGHTATRMVSELATHLDDSQLRVLGMINARPAENIANVLYASGIDSAVVPLDILNYARAQGVYPDLGRKIVYAGELFTEEVHLVASNSVSRVEDLIDQPVNLGLPGSPSEFTAAFLLDRLNIPVDPTYHDLPKALALLAKGELAAVFALSGKPMPLLADLKGDAGLRLLPLEPLAGEAYRPATLSSDDYPNLVAAEQEVPTFGVRTALIAYNWERTHPRYRVLSDFVSVFFDQLPGLQNPEAGYHPKWREVDPRRDLQGWLRSPAAENWLQEQSRPGGNDD